VGIGAIHAMNENSKSKLCKIRNQLIDLRNTLSIPLIIYIDINYDTRNEKFIKFEDSLKRLGLNVAKSNS